MYTSNRTVLWVGLHTHGEDDAEETSVYAMFMDTEDPRTSVPPADSPVAELGYMGAMQRLIGEVGDEFDEDRGDSLEVSGPFYVTLVEDLRTTKRT